MLEHQKFRIRKRQSSWGSKWYLYDPCCDIWIKCPSFENAVANMNLLRMHEEGTS